MLVFSTSDKGGTGRSVTSCNLAYRLSLRGQDIAYLDFDFGSPTSGALFEINRIDRGTPDKDGLHNYLTSANSMVTPHSVRSETNREELRAPRHQYRLMLFPGDRGGGEFTTIDGKLVKRCVELMVMCEQEYDVTFIDLSAGRSAALEIALSALAMPQLGDVVARWLVFHRWTRQHILAANGLVHGPNGLLETGGRFGHDPGRLLETVRYIRTAVPSMKESQGPGRGPQWAWLRRQNETLETLAKSNRLGFSVMLGKTPMEPVLQWREQVILDADVAAKIANEETVAAFAELATNLTDDATWERVY